MGLPRKKSSSRVSTRSKRTLPEMKAFASKPAKKRRASADISWYPANHVTIPERNPPLKSSVRAESNTELCNGKSHSAAVGSKISENRHYSLRTLHAIATSHAIANVNAGKIDSKDQLPRPVEPAVSFKLCHEELTSCEINQVKTRLKHVADDFVFEELQLRNCSVSDNTLTKFINVLGTTKVILLDISGNKNLNPTTVAKLIKNVRPERVILKECSLTVNEKLRNALFGRDTTVTSLDISHYGLEASSVEREVRLALMSPIKELMLVDCGLTSNFFKLLAERVTHVNTEVLDLSCNHLDAEAMKYLGQLLSKAAGLERLSLSDCQLDSDGLNIFARRAEARIREIDLSDNCLSNDRSLEEVTQIVLRLRPERLALNNCEIESVTKLQGSKKKKRIKLNRLELGENIRISTKEIGLLATAWQIQDLVLFNCQFTVEDIEELRLEVRDKQLTHLDVSDLSEIPSQAKRKAIDSLRHVVRNANVTYQYADMNECR